MNFSLMNSFFSKLELPDKSKQSYIFNKKNNEIRVILENENELKEGKHIK